ncbi:MAG: peptidyl-prolyl cis-trans isomerase [Desulfovibrio sp.]|nr:peptidyl-prolyl cis-trans isomerase [Desulfovibrio sp.]
MKHTKLMAALLAIAGALLFAGPASVKAADPAVKIETTMGDIYLRLDADKAPITVANFLQYVQAGFYNGTIFHRVIKGFMIQGGGFTEAMSQKPTRAPIKNEAKNGLRNAPYTIAMARTSEPDSATAQFFINTGSNRFLDFDRASDGVGYAVFGKVVKGTEVVKKIEASQTTTRGVYQDVPVTPVVIKSVTLVK